MELSYSEVGIPVVNKKRTGNPTRYGKGCATTHVGEIDVFRLMDASPAPMGRSVTSIAVYTSPFPHRTGRRAGR